ncbi:cell adhesion molecule 2-like [Ranitomeya variabilis]|uniref:cell adhesion molecule 2-like n=1 Tax=Ranitomeya variabilis TaxID=490064 RepID=UPI00405691CF
MDLIKKCVVFVLLLQAGAALEVSAPTTYLATLGSDNVIPCEYTIEKPPVDPRFFAAFWLFQGKEILSFDNEVITTDSRYSLDTEKALEGRVDLSISDMSVSDVGEYICSVVYSPDWKMKDITVDVKAPPQVAITNRTVNEKSVLLCSVTGFNPADIEIKWFRGSERLSDVTEDRLLRNPDGTYSVNSTVTITPTEEDREQNISCRVQHESLNQPLQEDFQLGNTGNDILNKRS